MRFLFELNFHTNYFKEDEGPDHFVMVAFEGPAQLREDVVSGAIADLRDDIEGETVTHDFYGQDGGEWSRNGYSIYEADETEIENIINLWTEGLKAEYGDKIKDPVRYSFTVVDDEDYGKKDALAFEKVFCG